MLTGIPGATGPLKVVLSTPPITQLPLRVPTLAAFFDSHPRYPSEAWRVDCLLCLHHDSDLLDGTPTVVDGNNAGAVGAAKDRLTKTLGEVISALEALRTFSTMLGVPVLSDLTKFLDILAGVPADNLVITREEARGRLDYHPSWWDKASSMFMIGAPTNAPTLSLYERDDHEGVHRCDFRMPPRSLVASYWTLHESACTPGKREEFSSPPVIPDPGVLQEGRADAFPYGSFGNMAKSFKWRAAKKQP